MIIALLFILFDWLVQIVIWFDLTHGKHKP